MHPRNHPRMSSATCLAIAAVLTGGALAASPQDSNRRAPDTKTLAAQVNEKLGLTRSTLVEMNLDDAVPGEAFVTEITVGDETYTIDLEPYSVFGADYRLLEDDGTGALRVHESGPLRTYRGTVIGEPGLSVAANLLHDGLHMLFQPADDGGRWWLQPAVSAIDTADASTHVLYHDDELLPRDHACGTTAEWLADKDVFGEELDAMGADGAVAGGQPVDCYWFTELACDVDNIYYLANGSSIPNIEGKIAGIVNLMNVQYEDQVIIHHVITTILVRTTPTYSATTNMGVLLTEFRNRWLSFHGGIQRDVAKLFTGRDASGTVIGQAWTIGSICSNSSSYCVVEDIAGINDQADLSAHELGHLWDADHCNCDGYTMSSVQVVAGLQFHPTFTVPEMSAYRNVVDGICLNNDCIPQNNNCADAILVTAGTTFFDTDNTTTDGPSDALCTGAGSSQVDNDIWFEYVAPCDGDITISLCGSNFDTRVAVYPNSCPPFANSAIACDDNSGCAGGVSEVTFAATDGTNYFIRVGGTNEATGTGEMEIIEPVCIPAPGNNSCGSAGGLVAGTTPFSTIGATTTGPDEVGSDCDVNDSSQITNDIWYRHNTSCEETITISLCNADFDTRLAVYGSTCPAGPGALVACNDDACGLQSEVSFAASPGIYRIRIGGYDGATGSGDIVLTCGAVKAECLGDSNDDGMVNVDDLNNVILDWGTDGTANGGDITGPTPGSPPDGMTDVNDLNAVIVNWGACP